MWVVHCKVTYIWYHYIQLYMHVFCNYNFHKETNIFVMVLGTKICICGDAFLDNKLEFFWLKCPFYSFFLLKNVWCFPSNSGL